MATEGYKPTAGMQSAARRAIKLKEQGKAKGAGTAVGWTRAGQLARGETLSLSTVKRMYSFFSRHEVDKKGKDWDNAENPSNGKIMWLAWGGDAGFSWSRKIVEREKNKSMKKALMTEELVEEIKDILEEAVNPIDTVIEIDDDEDIKKALRPEVTKEQLGMVIEHLMEAIEGMIEVPEEDEEEMPEPGDPEDAGIERAVSVEKAYENCGCETCKAMNVSCDKCPVCSEEMSKSYESDNEEEDKWDNMEKACWSGYKQEGMKEKNGRMVPNCVPVEKSYHEKEEELDKAKDKYKEVIDDRKGEPSDKDLYARVVAEAKRKFDVYPSAYANGWVVQEYKRRGGTYKVQKSIWNGTFFKQSLTQPWCLLYNIYQWVLRFMFRK